MTDLRFVYDLGRLIGEESWMDYSPFDTNSEMFYTHTRYKSREWLGMLYQPYVVDESKINSLFETVVHYHSTIHEELRLCKIESTNLLVLIGDFDILDPLDVVYYSNITPIGLMAIYFKIWKKEWGIPSNNSMTKSVSSFILNKTN